MPCHRARTCFRCLIVPSRSRYPEDLENALRLAEALVILGDVEAAWPHLCACRAGASRLRKDDQQLLEQLAQEARLPDCPPTPAAAAALR